MDTRTIRATKHEALQFRAVGRPDKLSIVATKPLVTRRDLSLAASPGVVFPSASGAPPSATPRKETSSR